MSKFLVGHSVILYIVAMFAATPANAGMLLAQVNWRQPDQITMPAVFSYNVYKDTPNPSPSVGIGTLVTSFDEFPKTTVDEDPSSIALWNSIVADGERVIRRARISNDGQIINPPFGHSPFDAIWFPDPDPNDSFNVKAYVPNLGGDTLESGLVGYWLSSVRHVVTPEGQTVYFYGTVIPEPSSALLLLLAGVMHVSVRRRR
jgi:hypothetical protein